jgi:predicted RNA-binding Zn-ribbon protein involved in translation (DUF1610 family)
MRRYYGDYDAYPGFDEHDEPEGEDECPECGEFTLATGKTQRFYEYNGGPEISPPETPVRCTSCGYEDVI